MNFAFDCSMVDYGSMRIRLAVWGDWILTIDHRPSTGSFHPEVKLQDGDWAGGYAIPFEVEQLFISLLLEQSLNLASSKMKALRVFILQYALVVSTYARMSNGGQVLLRSC
jgi:hypothetical protein